MTTQETIKQLNVGGVLRDVEDVTARGLISSLQTALDALTSGDTTTAIESFNEIVAFLENVSDSSTLQGIIAGLNTSIAAKYTKPGTGIPASDLAQAVQSILDSVANKANSADVYTKSQTYDKSEVDAKVEISSGTYEQAVTRSQTDSSNFMWILEDTLGSDTIRKPIFHVGNGVFVDMAGGVVEIGEVPNAPTFTMSDTTSTPNEFPVGGGTVAISAGTGETIYYTTNGDTPTTSSTEYDDSEPIQVTEDTTIKAIAVNRFGSSEVASETFTIAVDHKFQFKIKLTGNNSTEYIPVAGSGYTMNVDWGDGSEEESYDNQYFANKALAHEYTGSAGDEFTITLRGSAIPKLCFGNSNCCNQAALVAVLENTLTCDTSFEADAAARGGFYNCTELTSLSADALQNNTNPVVSFQNTKLTSLPDGLLSHLTKSGTNLTSVNGMFYATSIALTTSQVSELKSSINSVTNFSNMFYNFKGSVTIPDDFFSGLTDGTVTTVSSMLQGNSNGVITADAGALYNALKDKVTVSATTSHCFNYSGQSMTNRSQVPTTWGGTMSV